MSFTISKVDGKQDQKDFLQLPYRIYRGDSHQVFPLLDELGHFFDRKKNPFFNHAVAEQWIARDSSGTVVGRIAAAVDQYNNDHQKEEVGFFGFYEADDDLDLANLLLSTARDWIAGQGMQTMRGPGCFTSNHDWFGVQVDGLFNRPVVGMPYNPKYYQRHFENFGLLKAKDLFAWHMESNGLIPEKIQRLIDRILSRPGLKIRNFDMKRFDEEASLLRGLYNDCWSENWGFIPMDDADFAYSAKDMKSMVDPAYILIAEMEGKPIGFSVTFPDFNQATQPMQGRMYPFGWLKFLLAKRKISAARMPLMGVLPDYRKLGVDVALVYRSLKAVFENGITGGECSWILEDNKAMNRILAGYGADMYKTYRIYEKPVA
jgi:GNAT superfamily N-acetyltransferase